MFEDNKNPNIKYDLSNLSFLIKHKIKFVILFLIFIVLFLVFNLFLYIESRNKNISSAVIDRPVTTVSSSSLPVNQEAGGLNTGDNDNFDNIKAEALSFAGFYEKNIDTFSSDLPTLKLPIQAKTEIANYYELSRKINFDSNITELNSNGATILKNPLASEANNFYSLYAALAKRDIPQLVTTDFLMYYYQNLNKELFAEIKSNAFYKELWRIDKAFFDIASNRYKKNKIKSGDVNDPILEGQRLEAAYFAVSLELLKPKIGQVSAETQGISENQFSAKEAENYNFVLPDFLYEDVAKEVELILKAGSIEKSPVMLYSRNYSEFAIPNDVKNNAKLSNFSLAINWKKSVFPLYPRDESCKDCLLDKNDWAINQVAANYIAQDFSQNQELKNRWARIYKVVSYFSGLRKDLTYLQYLDVLKDQFGENFQVENIFSTDVEQSVDAGIKIQKQLSDRFKFSKLEGGYDRQDKGNRQIIGMRLLQEAYWPDNYIFEELTSPKVLGYTKKQSAINNDSNNNTLCMTDGSSISSRCNGIGLDVINLVNPVISNKYFIENTSYQNYNNQVVGLKDQLSSFDVFGWHNNSYWTNLDITRLALGKSNSINGPINFSTDVWRGKQLSTALGAWVNLRLPADKLENAVQENNSFGSSVGLEVFVEPNLKLVTELSLNTKMLSKMLYALRVVSETDYSAKRLGEFSLELDRLVLLIKKELSGEVLDPADQQLLTGMLKKFSVKKQGDKVARIRFKSSSQSILESIDGVNLLLSVYQLGDRKILLAGPVFNYFESR